MTAPGAGKQPATWQDYDQGCGSPGSESHIQWAGPLDRQESGTSVHSHLAVPHETDHNGNESQVRRRR